MAKARPPSEPQSARLSTAQIKSAIPRLQKRISDLEAFDPSTLQEVGGPEVTKLRAAIDDTLTEIFGRGTVEYKRYRAAAILDSGPLSLTGSWGRTGPDLRFKEGYRRSRDNAIALLNQAIESLQERVAHQIAEEQIDIEEEATAARRLKALLLPW